ncbi:MAG: glycosyltransferase family 1 protein [Bosea sp. (in: a-proteobacteria)]|nr:MAG: glycosyltransferase family 1 protein [Bosea sp. (in: a-proteobacteria)]SIR47562.1 Glycosyltransferase involved in cell wall bisynthesis [Bosea sp. TND4EK4]
MRLMIHPAARGGILTVVENYAASGFTDADTRFIQTYRDAGFLRRQLIFLQALAACLRAFVSGRASLAHIHAAARGSFWRKAMIARLAAAFRVPVIFHLHGSEMKLFYSQQPSWRRRLIGRVLTRASHVVVLSDSWADFVADVAPGARVTVVPNYVEVGPEAKPAVAPVEILFLGLVGPRKGTFDLLRAFAKARQDFPAMHLTIGGNGDIEEASRLIDELGLGDSVRMAGWVGPQEKHALLSKAAIYVLPSHNEGLPMSVLEAMSYGIATVTTRVGGLPEAITDGVDGLLIEPGDIDALRASIVDLCRDEEARKAIGQAARQRIVTHYSAEAALPRLAQLYESVTRDR